MATEEKAPSSRRRGPFIFRNRWGKALFLLICVAIPVLLFVLSPGARQVSFDRLGYGLVAAALYALAAVTALLYRPRLLYKRWKAWASLAFIAAAALGILSYVNVQDMTGLSGAWGRLLGRPSAGVGAAFLGALKVVALLSVASAILFPKATLRSYWRLLEELLAIVWAVAYLASRGVFLASKAGWQRLKLLLAKTRPIQEKVVRKAIGPVKGTAESAANAGARLSRELSMRARVPPPPWEKLYRREGTAATESKAAKGHSVKPVQPQPTTANGTPAWSLPPVDLLSKASSQSLPPTMLHDMAQRIERTLGEHGMEVNVETIRTGPRIILFGLAPGWVKRHGEGDAELARVKVDSIMAREKDLALVLKTTSIRLQSPMPGEPFVGIEVPNPKPSVVSLRSVVESEAFTKLTREGHLPLSLGQGVGGEPMAVDLKEMPHLLIAGATGSGKSVCLNTMISSLLLTRTPYELRMIMVDPKRVELTPYNGIPHLLAPVIVDMERVVPALGAVIKEMFRRYKLMEEAGVRNIEGYTRKTQQTLPHLIVIVDELADLMMTSAYEVEQSLVRLAQLGRATGIHLIVATQRPSVNVVTGLMKANIPTRIAFAVASQVDSRVILDNGGAEKLLGKGDMLLLSSASPKPVRIQGAFVSDREIEKLVLYWRSQREVPMPTLELEHDLKRPPEGEDSEADEGDPAEDDLLTRARQIASRSTRLSPALLQRRLRIGYPRAMKLMEELEVEGLVASGAPGASRQVIPSNKEGTEPS
ncbi:MAG: DNA translocase FtsK [Chloroflexota bacterium]|nr:DNA translocase FtsK [Chloroflexota bacterium]